MEPLAQGKENAEDCQIVEVDINEAKDKAYNEFNDLIGDRRPNYYSY